MAFSWIAGGNIAPSRFVKASTTANNTALQATDGSASHGDPVVGISQKGTHNVPGTIGGVAIDDGYAAIAGMSVGVYDQADSEKGQFIDLELGGTVAAGDYLKSDANGKGVTSSTDGDYYGARTFVAGVAGQLVRVQIITGMRGA